MLLLSRAERISSTNGEIQCRSGTSGRMYIYIAESSNAQIHFKKEIPQHLSSAVIGLISPNWGMAVKIAQKNKQEWQLFNEVN